MKPSSICFLFQIATARHLQYLLLW